jgi:hypothetical protein
MQRSFRLINSTRSTGFLAFTLSAYTAQRSEAAR